MNALLLLAAGVLLALEAGHRLLRGGSSPGRGVRWLARARTPWGLACTVAIGALNLPPRNGAGWILLLGALGWIAARVLAQRPGRAGGAELAAARRPWRRRREAAGLAVLALMPLAWGGSSLFAARHLLTRPEPWKSEPRPDVSWARLEELRLRTSDDLELGAWWIEGRPGQPSVIVLHGNGGCRSRELRTARFLAGEGCSVLLVSLRAHGDSAGVRHDYGRGSRLDVIAAAEECRRRRPDDERIVLGRSLGSAAALCAAEELGDRVDAYFLESPFLTLRHAMHDRLDRRFAFPFNWLAVEGLLAAGDLWMEAPDEHAPGELLPTIPPDARVLLLFGRTDRQAPPQRFDEVRRRRPGTEIAILDLGGHRPMMPRDPEGYAAVWREWRSGD